MLIQKIVVSLLPNHKVMSIFKVTKVVKEIMISTYTVNLNVENEREARVQVNEHDNDLEWYEDTNEMDDSEILSVHVEELL